MTPIDFWQALDELIRRDPGGRGVAALDRTNPLEEACRDLLEAESVLLMTGFIYLSSETPETDGPLGTLALGDALEALGKNIGFLTDPPCRDLLEELEALPLLVPNLEGLSLAARHQMLEETLEVLGTTHVVSIERSGRDQSGRYRNLSGRDIGAFTAPLDEIFLMAPELGLRTLAIGDGGNEVGMGSLAPEIRTRLFGRLDGSCVVPADRLVVAGVSDWGAYGLVAGLSHLCGQNLLPPPLYLEERMRVMLEMGAVDGITGEDQPSIDGIPLSASLSILEEMAGLLDFPER